MQEVDSVEEPIVGLNDLRKKEIIKNCGRVVDKVRIRKTNCGKGWLLLWGIYFVQFIRNIEDSSEWVS